MGGHQENCSKEKAIVRQIYVIAFTDKWVSRDSILLFLQVQNGRDTLYKWRFPLPV